MPFQQLKSLLPNIYSIFSAREKFSVAELRRLHGILLKPLNKFDVSSRTEYIEALRSIAEIIIWYESMFWGVVGDS